MAFNYRTGPNNTSEYMASGLPYVTQSAVTSSPFNIQFPFVTNEVTVKNNTDGILRVGFTQNGVNGSNFFTLPVSGAYSGKLRITDLFVRSETGTVTCEIVAGLTTIPRQEFYILTGALNVFSGSEQQILDYGLRGLGYGSFGGLG
ncbi:hypothetical protein EBU71_06580 [bacterium]|nr:hypothetical protein [Candidatus Elulimicrobium humile]